MKDDYVNKWGPNKRKSSSPPPVEFDEEEEERKKKIEAQKRRFNALLEVTYREAQLYKLSQPKPMPPPPREKIVAEPRPKPKSTKKKMTRRRRLPRERISAELPAELREKLEKAGGRGFRILMDKKLTATDVTENNNRLSLPSGYLVASEMAELLTATEKETLKKTKEDKKLIVEVQVADADLELRDMGLKYWMMETTAVLNLVGWNGVRKSHGLKVDHFIQLWGFRLIHDNKLAFALVDLGVPKKTK